jgi:hypothetical protein
MAIISGFKSATVDDVKPFQLPIDEMAKGLLAIDTRATAAKNALATATSSLNIPLRDNVEDWNLFDTIVKEFDQEKNKLIDSVGGDFSKLNIADLQKLALDKAQDHRFRQLVSAKKNADEFQEQLNKMQAAGKVPVTFGINPLYDSLYDENGRFRFMNQYEIMEDQDIEEPAQKMFNNLGHSLEEAIKWHHSSAFLTKEQQEQFWYDFWQKDWSKIKDNYPNISAVIKDGAKQLMNEPAGRVHQRKLYTMYSKQFPTKSRQEVDQMIEDDFAKILIRIGNSRRIRELNKTSDRNYNQKPQQPSVGSPGMPSGKGSKVEAPERLNIKAQEFTYTAPGFNYLNQISPGEASRHILNTDINLANSGINWSQFDPANIGSIDNINLLGQYLLAVPTFDKKIEVKGLGGFDFAGGIYQAAQNTVIIGGNEKEKWRNNPTVLPMLKGDNFGSAVTLPTGYFMADGKSYNDILNNNDIAYNTIRQAIENNQTYILEQDYARALAREAGVTSDKDKNYVETMKTVSAIIQQRRNFSQGNSMYNFNINPDTGLPSIGVDKTLYTVLQLLDEDRKEVDAEGKPTRAAQLAELRYQKLSAKIKAAEEFRNNSGRAYFEKAEATMRTKAEQAATFDMIDDTHRVAAGMKENEYFIMGNEGKKSKLEDKKEADILYKKAIVTTAYAMSNSSISGVRFKLDYADLSESTDSLKNKLGDTMLNITEKILRREFRLEDYLTKEEIEEGTSDRLWSFVLSKSLLSKFFSEIEIEELEKQGVIRGGFSSMANPILSDIAHLLYYYFEPDSSGKTITYTNQEAPNEYNQKLQSSIIESLKQNKSISPAALRYYESLTKSKLNREAALTYRMFNETDPDTKHYAENIKSLVVNKIMADGTADTPIYRAHYNSNNTKVLREQAPIHLLKDQLRELYDKINEKNTTGKLPSYEDFIKDSVTVLGVTWEPGQTGSDDGWVVGFQVTIDGTKHHWQIPVSQTELPMTVRTMLGFDNLELKYSPIVQQSLKQNGGLFYDLDSRAEGSSPMRVFVAHAPMTLRGVNGDMVSLQVGQRYIIGSGNPAIDPTNASEAGIRAFKNDHEAWMYYDRNKAYGKNYHDLVFLNSILKQMALARSPQEKLAISYRMTGKYLSEEAIRALMLKKAEENRSK